MKRVKKSLGLVLALVMTLSTAVMGAGAAFTDQYHIHYYDAVETCVKLNIINGMPDGSFSPKQNLTREQMSKMICAAILGGTVPTISDNAKLSFTDTRDSWAKAYIEVCAKRGIVGGVGNGRFCPKDQVTGIQAAKMLLVTLGYDSKFEGFSGPDWSTNINALARRAGLYAGMLPTFNPYLPITREETAQLVANTVNSFMVEYDYSGRFGSGPVALSAGHTFYEAFYSPNPPTPANGNSLKGIAGFYRVPGDPNGNLDFSLDLNKDGSFTGRYWFMDPTVSGPHFSLGSAFTSDFTGQFMRLNHLDNYTDMMYVDSFTVTAPAIEVLCKNEIRTVRTAPECLQPKTKALVYHKGIPLSQMSDQAETWVYQSLGVSGNGRLPCIVLFFPEYNTGFAFLGQPVG